MSTGSDAKGASALRAIGWVVEQRVGRAWLACGHGPYETKAEADEEAAVIGIGLTAGPFRVQQVDVAPHSKGERRDEDV